MQGATGAPPRRCGGVLPRFPRSTKKQQPTSTFSLASLQRRFLVLWGSDGSSSAKVDLEQVLHFLLREKWRGNPMWPEQRLAQRFCFKWGGAGGRKRKSRVAIYIPLQGRTLIDFQRTILLILLQKRRSDSNPDAVLSPTAGHAEECRAATKLL